MKQIAASLAVLAVLTVCATGVAQAEEPPKTAATETSQNWKDVEDTLVLVPEGYLLIDWDSKVALQLPLSAIRKVGDSYQMMTGVEANCVALAAGPGDVGFTGDRLTKTEGAEGVTVDGVKIFRRADCVCHKGDKCCCPDGWTCCNGNGRCCCKS